MLDKGIFQFGKVTIEPNMHSALIEDSDIFQIIRLKTATIYFSEVKLGSASWDLRITARQGIIKDLELRMIERMAVYRQLEEKYAAHNRFLKEQLGSADKKGLGRIEYLFEWGSICSYVDIKTGECVIRNEYMGAKRNL